MKGSVISKTAILLIGQLPTLGEHDYADRMGVTEKLSNPVAPYSIMWSCHMSDPASPMWVCAYCGVFKDASVKLMVSEGLRMHHNIISFRLVAV